LQLAYNLNSFKGMGLMTKCTALHHSFIRTAGCFGSCFSGGQKARIQAKIAESVAENDIANMEFNLQNQRKKASGLSG
jgi:cobalt-zinc-cadmium resistance protein CzcA